MYRQLKIVGLLDLKVRICVERDNVTHFHMMILLREKGSGRSIRGNFI